MRKFVISKYLLRIVLLNSAAAALVVVLSAYPLGWERAFSFASIARSLVYSHCIGTLISLTIRFCAARFLSENAVLRFVQIIAVIFAATFVGVTLANVILTLFNLSDSPNGFAPRAGSLIFALLIALIFGVSTFFYEFAQAQHRRTKELLRQTELNEARAQNLATAAQLASLESRLHPHFLFNTLNSIASLIREDADLAEKTVERLADLLRYSLDANASQTVDLKQEVEITIGYLEIERARFGERLRYEIEIDKQFFDQKVPPFALQTLIENSIKHVAAKRPGAIEIRVAARRVSECLEIEVADDGAGFSNSEIKPGHGLDTLQKRFAAIFGDGCGLQINENATGGLISFRVPLNPQYELQSAPAVNSAAAAPARLFG